MSRFVCGPNAVATALSARAADVHAVFVQKGLHPHSARTVYRAADRAGVPFSVVPKAYLDALVSVYHQGVVAVCGAFPYASFEHVADQERALIVVLDQVQDPGNLGAIVRSAVAFGATGVVICKDRSASVTPGCVRASAGATELIPIAKVVNLYDALMALRDRGIQVWGADVRGDVPLDAVPWNRRTAVVLGNESKGLRQRTVSACDGLFSIPMPGGFESLNVAAAAAVTLYAASRSGAFAQ